MNKYVKIADITTVSPESAHKISAALVSDGFEISDLDDTHLLVYEKAKRDKDIQEVLDFLGGYASYNAYREAFSKVYEYISKKY